ncbi:hypothetical protein [uncultured Methanobrevibacter sp.]|nr:hypothetical protein [uncultured Methanobrevibacter sp.]
MQRTVNSILDYFQSIINHEVFDEKSRITKSAAIHASHSIHSYEL